MQNTNISNTFFLLFIIISMNMIGFSDSKKLQKFLNTNKNWFNIVNVGDLCVGSNQNSGSRITQQICGKTDNVLWKITKDGDNSYLTSKTGNVLNNLGGIIVNGHDVFGTHPVEDYSEVWTIKKLENSDKVQIYNNMAKMCLSDEGKILINSTHKIRHCDKRNANQLFEIKSIKYDD